jgi:hypothetical protein
MTPTRNKPVFGPGISNEKTDTAIMMVSATAMAGDPDEGAIGVSSCSDAQGGRKSECC